MSQSREETVLDEGLSSALLRIVNDDDKVDRLHEVLSEFCHRCRNSLNGIKLGFYLCDRESRGNRPCIWSDLEETYEFIEKTIDELQTIYRPLNLTMIESGLCPMISEHEASWRVEFAEQGKALVIDKPAKEPVGYFDPMHLGQGLDTLISWRAEASPIQTKARLSWMSDGERFQVAWQEDAPSPAVPMLEKSSGSRVPLSGLKHQVDPLAVPLLARVLRAHNGRLLEGHGDRFSLTLWWPLKPKSLT